MKFVLSLSKESAPYLRIFLLCSMFSGCVSSTQNSASPQPAIQSKDFVLTVAPSKTEAYPDEKIMLQYKLAYKQDVAVDGYEDTGRFVKFWSQPILYKGPGSVKIDIIRLNNQRYASAIFLKKAIFATEPGDHTIDPGEIQVAYSQKTERLRMVLKSDPITLHIKEFPAEGMPENFTGSTGIYTLSARIQDPNQARSGKILLEVIVKGGGNIRNVQLPTLNLGKDLKLFAAGKAVHTEASWGYETVSGSKTFLFILIPTRKGAIELPTISFSFFNPFTKEYRTLMGLQLTAQVDSLSFKTKSYHDPRAIKDKNAVMVLLDESSTMLARDMLPQDRFTVAKRAINLIALSSKESWIGLKTFDEDVSIARPLSEVDNNLFQTVDHLQVDRSRDGTAIGNAIYEGMTDLAAINPAPKNRYLVLLTDGDNNRGFIDAYAAADLTRKRDIPIYVIGIGKDSMNSLFDKDFASGALITQAKGKSNEEMLRVVADVSGGKYFRVQNEEQLITAVKEIAQIISTK